MFKRTILVLGVFVLMFITTGCGVDNLVENKMERDLQKQLGGDVDIDMDNGEINIQTEDGSFQAGGNVKIPEDFPEDVYVVEGELISAMKNVVGVGTQVMISTDKSISEVAELYNGKLVEEDWDIQVSMNLGEGAMLSAVKGERQVSVSVNEGEDSKTAVILTIVEKN